MHYFANAPIYPVAFRVLWGIVSTTPSLYTNPLFPEYRADPFALRTGDGWYVYATGPASPEGCQFPVLYSADLVHWQDCGWALAALPGGIEYWAPEVAEHDGLYYLYYSVSGIAGRDHQLRVATSTHPAGPFTDSGRVLMPDDPFTIDAHPFRDATGQWYLFYSRDFLTPGGDYRVGTGIVVDRLTDMLTLAGEPQVVVRPYADWHLFQAARPMYGAVYNWHTIEGAALRLHDGRYYCFYSGGSWQRDNYGVAYVVADHPLGPYVRPGEINGPLLRSAPGHVIGPGHNSFTESPDGQEYIVYHGWDPAMTARLLRIDRLTWDGGRPVIHGPTWTPQPAPQFAPPD